MRLINAVAVVLVNEWATYIETELAFESFIFAENLVVEVIPSAAVLLLLYRTFRVGCKLVGCDASDHKVQDATKMTTRPLLHPSSLLRRGASESMTV